MSSGVTYKQDLPPKGGFAPIRYKRNLPARGPSGTVLLAGVLGISIFGFYRVGLANQEKREIARERAWSRIYLTPMILAEGDRDTFRRETAAIAREKELMKDVPGWEVGKSVYHTKRYNPGNFVVM
ncbi:hypothetical protein MSPP1_001421 [Malassezia sp. CBS 17886]|nr:hypothetical protein MSPP1_001421 [Malassezia sp. CBS 17886]